MCVCENSVKNLLKSCSQKMTFVTGLKLNLKLKIIHLPSVISLCKNVPVKATWGLPCVIYSLPSIATPSMGDTWTCSPSRDDNLLLKTDER